MKHLKIFERSILAGFLLLVLTLSFAQIAFYDPMTISHSFTIADQEGLPARGNPGMVYDNESDLIVIFGGWNNTAGSPWNTTYTYDYNSDTYTLIDPATSPLWRAEPGMAYDPGRDQVILFGGEDSLDTPNPLNDTWLYDDGVWTQLSPSTAPSYRRGHSMSFDIESDRIIIFGGEPDMKNDTWAGNPSADTFVEMNPAIAPEGRTSAAMAYDSESDRIILFGGFKGGSDVLASNYFGDTWAYDYNTDTWENLTTTGSPSVRGAASMAYDSESDRIVLFGGSMSSTSYDDT
ncbi:MAG: kelch repeat-containing protein, partial [Promethearchaeota archaeon]